MPNSRTLPSSENKRFFSLEEANRALPLVRMIVADIVQKWENVNQLEQRLKRVSHRTPEQNSGDLYDEEVVRSQTELEQERSALHAYLEELSKLGVELKGFDGLCDFPSLRDGREVYLCWRLGEATVAHWHEIDAGFAGRRPIEDEPTGNVTALSGHSVN